MSVQLNAHSGRETPGSAVLEVLLTGLLVDVFIGLLAFDRALTLALAALALGLFVWRSLKLYRSGVMSLAKQCALLLVAPAAGCLWLFLIVIQMKPKFM